MKRCSIALVLCVVCASHVYGIEPAKSVLDSMVGTWHGKLVSADGGQMVGVGTGRMRADGTAVVFKEKWFPLDLGNSFGAVSIWKIGDSPDKLVSDFSTDDGTRVHDEIAVTLQGKELEGVGKRTGVDSEGKPLSADIKLKVLDKDCLVFELTNLKEDGKPVGGFTLRTTRVKFEDQPAAN